MFEGPSYGPRPRILSLSCVSPIKRDQDACGFCPSASPTFDLADPEALGRGEVDVNQYNDFIDQNFLGGIDRNSTTAIWENRFDIGDLTLTSITGYWELESDLFDDLNRAPGDFAGFIYGFHIDDEYEVFSQELRLASADDRRFRWQLGLYYYDSDFLSDIDFLLDSNNTRIPFTDTAEKIENKAIFADVNYDLSDSVTLNLGLRYDKEDRSQADLGLGTFQSASFSELLPRISLLFAVSDNSNAYVTYSKGYKSGGFNTVDSEFPIFQPEYLDNYEVGIKGVSGDRAFSYEVAAFYGKWTDQHVSVTSATNTQILNAGETTTQGIETTLAYAVTRDLTLSGSYSWIDAKYDEFIDLSTNPVFFGYDSNYNGVQVPLQPEHSGTLSLEYHNDLGMSSAWAFVGRGDVRYTGKRNLFPGTVLEQDAFTRVNLSVGLENDNWSLSLFADNVFDEKHHVGGILGAGIRPMLITAMPRIYGVRVIFKN